MESAQSNPAQQQRAQHAARAYERLSSLLESFGLDIKERTARINGSPNRQPRPWIDIAYEQTGKHKAVKIVYCLPGMPPRLFIGTPKRHVKRVALGQIRRAVRGQFSGACR